MATRTTPLPGQPGNPGRPLGAKNKRLELLRSHDQKLQKKVIDLAMKGDTAALKIVADRLWPRLRSQASPVLIDAALSGGITVDVLRDLLGALYLQGQITELSELEQRLAALENNKAALPCEQQGKPEPLPFRGKRKEAGK